MEAALSRELSARLRAVAEAVPRGARVADVGTDHAQLLAWLRAAGRIAAGIGIDVATGPLQQARRTLELAGVDGVELRQGDGLHPLRPGEVDVVVLAGMGGARIVRLVQASPGVVSGLRALVLQPNTDWVLVRRALATRRWALRDEQMVEDRGKFYVVLTVEPRARDEHASAAATAAAARAWSEDALVLGPRLLVERPPAFVAWLRHELRRTERALGRALAGAVPGHDRPDARADARVLALRAHADRLREALRADASPRRGVEHGLR